MDDRWWKFWRRQPSSGALGQDEPEHDELGHVAAGDPDPSTASGYRTCGFTWTDETSTPTLILPWLCTRELGHQGQHIAGTGEEVAAVPPAPTDGDGDQRLSMITPYYPATQRPTDT